MTWPRLRSTMPGSSAWVRWTRPTTFTCIIRSQAARSALKAGSRPSASPALFTSTSTARHASGSAPGSAADRRSVRDVEREGEEFVAELCPHRLELVRAPRRADHAVAVADESSRHRGAESGARAGDQDRAAHACVFPFLIQGRRASPKRGSGPTAAPSRPGPSRDRRGRRGSSAPASFPPARRPRYGR